jgi:hypothetical protein
VTLTRAQRDAIYQMVVNHLSGIGDVWISVQGGDFATAKRLGRDFAEYLRLLEDLGWTETTDRETVALTVPADELTRTLARLHKDAAGSLGTDVSRPKDDEELAQRDLAASEALGEVLGQIAKPTHGTGTSAAGSTNSPPSLAAPKAQCAATSTGSSSVPTARAHTAPAGDRQAETRSGRHQHHRVRRTVSGKVPAKSGGLREAARPSRRRPRPQHGPRPSSARARARTARSSAVPLYDGGPGNALRAAATLAACSSSTCEPRSRRAAASRAADHRVLRKSQEQRLI